MERRICPGCQSVMQTFVAEGVEIERCFFCGGFFFDPSELDRVSGRALPVEPGTEASARRCAACGETLHRARIEDLAVERCPSCRGVYLDDGELERLKGARPTLEPTEAEKARRALFVKCCVCRDEIDPDLGITTSVGIACRSCAPLARRRAEAGSTIPGLHPNRTGDERTTLTGSAQLDGILSLVTNLLRF